MTNRKAELGFIFYQLKNKKPEIIFNDEAEKIICFPSEEKRKSEALNRELISLCRKWQKILERKIGQRETKSKDGKQNGPGNLIFLGTYLSYRRQYEVFGTLLLKKTPSNSSSHKVYFFVLKRPESERAIFQKISREKRLTPQQRKMINLLLLGLSNKEIAADLGLSVNTVKTYMKNLAMKLGVKSRLEITMAVSQSMLSALRTATSKSSLKK